MNSIMRFEVPELCCSSRLAASRLRSKTRFWKGLAVSPDAPAAPAGARGSARVGVIPYQVDAGIRRQLSCLRETRQILRRFRRGVVAEFQKPVS